MSADGPISHRFDSRDPQLIRDYLAGAYGAGGLRLSSSDRDYHLRHRGVRAGRFQADRLAQSTDLRVAVEEINSLVVCEAATSRVDRSCDGEQGEYVPGDVFVAATPGRPYRLRWQPGEVALLQLDTHLFTQLALPDVRRRPEPIRFTALEPASPALAEHWRATAHYVRLAVLGNTEASREPLVIGAAARALAAAALAVFPNTARTEPTAQDRRDAVAPWRPLSAGRSPSWRNTPSRTSVPPMSPLPPPSRSAPCSWPSGVTRTAPRWPSCAGSAWNGHTTSYGRPTHAGRR